MPDLRDPYYRSTTPFIRGGEQLFVEVLDQDQTLRLRRTSSEESVEETLCPITGAGCYIHEIAASPSGRWVVTQRLSGQGEWGYDLFSTDPLQRVGGVSEERGYMLDLPSFSEDESYLVGGAGAAYLGGWWSHPWGDCDEPARGGLVALGFLFVHNLSDHEDLRHDLVVNLPEGWLPDDPWAAWYGPRQISADAKGVRLVPSWGVQVVVPHPLPRVIVLPTPHPSGKGLLVPRAL